MSRTESAEGSPTPHPSALPVASPRRTAVLWIDDQIDAAVFRALSLDGFAVDRAATGAAGVVVASESTHDALIVELRLPDMYGVTVLERLAGKGIVAPALVVTGSYIQAESERAAIRAGAVAFRQKPLFVEDLGQALRDIIASRPCSPASMLGYRDGVRRRAAGQVRCHCEQAGLPPPEIVAVSPSMRDILTQIRHVARTKVTVLLVGETGTGKELLAHAIHCASGRRAGPFVPVNCGAIPDGLLESELFGHRKGAFTGAVDNKTGLVEAAQGGTLLLDEIGEMPAAMQVRLLRFLDEGRVRAVGETSEKTVDVRVIAATNRQLRKDVARGRFREDLYYRLAVATIYIPPLRDRPEDLDALVRHWLPRLAASADQRQPIRISARAIRMLQGHRWPGNARELRNVLEQALCLTSSGVVTERAVSSVLWRGLHPTAKVPADAGDPLRKCQMQSVLEDSHWNRTKAAQRLGIGRTTLWRWLRKTDMS